MLTEKHKHPIFLKSILGLMTILSFGLYIDINGKNIFISDPNDKTAGFCFIGVGISIIVLLIVLRQKGKII